MSKKQAQPNLMRDRSAVVLVHGLWMNRYVFAPTAVALRRDGFSPYLFGYPSLRRDIEANAAQLASFVAQLPEKSVHLVGHSLGGLIILRMLMNHTPARIGRAVLLGSPVRGSFVGRSLAGRTNGKLLLGVSLLDWNASPLDTWSNSTEIGIVAGSIRLGMATFFSRDLPVPNDGAVAVEETRVKGMKAHRVLPVSHTGLLLSRRVMRETATFLKTGEFSSATD